VGISEISAAETGMDGAVVPPRAIVVVHRQAMVAEGIGAALDLRCTSP